MYSERNGATEHGASRKPITYLGATFAAGPPLRGSPHPLSRGGPAAALARFLMHQKGLGRYCNLIATALKCTPCPFTVARRADAWTGLAPEIADCHVLDAALSASSSRGDYVAARAPAGDKCRFNQTEPGYDFELAEEG